MYDGARTYRIPVIRTKPSPDPHKAKNGLASLIGLAGILVFNSALSAAFEPYKGLYVMTDRLSFRKIWTSVAKKGFMTSGICNYEKSHIKRTLQPLLDSEEPWDDRWTCAGLTEVLVHLARALVYFSIRWDEESSDTAKDQPRVPKKDPREREDFDKLLTIEKKELEKEYCLSPVIMHSRVLGDLSTALGIPLHVSRSLVGSIEDCEDLGEETTLFPTTRWLMQTPRESQRPPSLWDALYTQESDAAQGDETMDVDEEYEDKEDEEDEAWAPGMKTKSKRQSAGRPVKRRKVAS